MKGRKENYPVSLIWFVIALLLLVVWIDTTWASGNKNEAEAEATVGDQVLKSSGSKALGLSYGMGDVDINEGQNCMGSEQKANVLWGSQSLALNPWCASLFYELNGKHEFAARVRCDIPEIIAHYLTAEECVLDQDLSPAVPDPSTADTLVAGHDKDIEYVRMEQGSLEDRIEALEQKPAPKPKIYQQAAPEPTIDDDRLEAAWMALIASDDDE